MARRFVVKNRKKRKLILTVLLVLFVVLGIGYSAISTTLSIQGSLSVDHYEDKRLYTVLKNAAVEGTYASEYLGEHNDSPTGTGTQKIYYWDANTLDNSNLVHNMDNVIFAGQCWKMIRTTDTGGVKMMYNGEAENGQCLTTRGNHVGYSSFTNVPQYSTSNYYFGTDYIYDPDTSKFTLSGEILQSIVSRDTISELTDYYTCLNSTSATAQCSVLYVFHHPGSERPQYDYYTIPIRSDSNYSVIGKLPNTTCSGTQCVDMVGYMYNDEYFNSPLAPYTKVAKESVYESVAYTETENYYYSDSIRYVDNHYEMFNANGSNVLSSLITSYFSYSSQYYYFCSENYYSNGVCSKPYVAEGSYSASKKMIYATELKDGNIYKPFVCSKDLIDNGDGTYSLQLTGCVKRALAGPDSYYVSDLIKSYYCADHSSTTCSASEMRSIVDVGNGLLSYVPLDPVQFGSSFTYDGSKYILNDTITTWAYQKGDSVNDLKNNRYTCFNDSGECSQLYYIYSYNGSITTSGKDLYVVYNISDGKGIVDILNLYFENNDINRKDSTLKHIIELWYRKYLISYSDYIEDTNYCNNRNIYNYGGFDMNNNYNLISSDKYLKFVSYRDALDSTSLYCDSIRDRFSVANSTAPLTYPVGLITAQEVKLPSYSYYWRGSESFITMSPGIIGSTNKQYLVMVGSDGTIINSNGVTSYTTGAGIRPVISLKNRVSYVSGVGSMEDPYIVNVE